MAFTDLVDSSRILALTPFYKPLFLHDNQLLYVVFLVTVLTISLLLCAGKFSEVTLS